MSMRTPGCNRLGGPVHEPYTYGPALTVGGGLDYALPFLGGHLGLRLFQADYEYFHANFGPQPPYPTGGRANLKVARLSTGPYLSHGQHPSAASCDLQLHRRPVSGVPWRSHHGYRHGGESEPEEDSNL